MDGRIDVAPIHVACIMDGNGRWATARGLTRVDGHAAGEAAILAFVDAAEALNIRWVTLFAFSTENWNRPAAEVAFLMRFNHGVIQRHGQNFHERGIRVRYLGARDERIPADLRTDMRAIELLTQRNAELTLTLAFNHGGRAEIVHAVRRIVAAGIHPDQIDTRLIQQFLEYPDTPDPDLVIRTSGEYRISNFMLWRIAYAELYFLDVLWPDFRGEHLAAAVRSFQERDRRFGRIPPRTAANDSVQSNAKSVAGGEICNHGYLAREAAAATSVQD